MNMQEYVREVMRGAILYKDNLLNKNLLFIGINNQVGQHEAFEASFLTRNYMHLVGVEAFGSLSSISFFDKCCENRLSAKDFGKIDTFSGNERADYYVIKNPKFAQLKTSILPELMKIQYSAKMFGNFNGDGAILATEKLAGNVRGCIGFSFDKSIKTFLPNTILRDDIRSKTDCTYQILAIYQKGLREALYPKTPTYVTKNLRWKELTWPQEISEKIIK